MNEPGRWQSVLSSLYKWTVSSLPLPNTHKYAWKFYWIINEQEDRFFFFFFFNKIEATNDQTLVIRPEPSQGLVATDSIKVLCLPTFLSSWEVLQQKIPQKDKFWFCTTFVSMTFQLALYVSV